MYGKSSVPEAVMQNAYGGTLSQRAANATRRRQGRGGGGEYWADTFKPHETVPANVRLIPVACVAQRADDAGNVYEENTPWKEFREHYHGTFRRSAICSGGPLFFDRNRRTACYGCDIFWSSPAGKGKRRPISMSDKYAFAALIMDPYHKVPQVDDRGQFQLNPTTQQPFTKWERCLGQGCPHCRSALETVQGRVQPWIMSKAHFTNLNAYSDRLGCLTCGGRATPDNRPVISTALWQCGNPACRQLIFDMSSTTATLEQIQAVVNKPYTCPVCQTTCYPEEVIQCANCTPAGQVPQRATIFDVDLQVIAPKTGDNEQTMLMILASCRIISGKSLPGPRYRSASGRWTRPSFPVVQLNSTVPICLWMWIISTWSTWPGRWPRPAAIPGHSCFLPSRTGFPTTMMISGEPLVQGMKHFIYLSMISG